MKKIELFGRRLTIGFEKKEKMKKEIKDLEYSAKEVVGEKVVYLILILLITVISANTYLFNGYLKLGDVATKDIVAPTDIVYTDLIAKEKIVSNIIENSQKEYISVGDIEENTIDQVNLFFKQVKRVKKEEGIQKYEKLKNDFNIEISDDFFIYLFERLDTQLDDLRVKYIEDIKILYINGVKKDGNLIRFDSLFESIDGVDSYEEEFLKSFVKPNYILDTKKTEELLKEKVDQIQDVSVHVKAGSVILKKGEVISEDKVIILKNVGMYGKGNQTKPAIH